MVKEYWGTYNEIAEEMGKIRVEDLSIGDWVCAKMAKWDYDDIDITPPMQVVRIDDKEVVLSLRWVEHCAFVDDLLPIEITNEVLEKNGLSEAEFGLVVKPKSDKLCASMGASIEIKYIHELQHLLRLTKAGKEIML